MVVSRSIDSKRIFDAISSAAGLVVLSPLLALTAAVCAVCFKGRVFDRVPRLGRSGVTFQMYKFHSTSGAGRYRAFFGKFLRATSIDELPQMWNILKGDMSVVGPRPREASLQGNDSIPPEYRDILSVRPGLTGAWQVAAIGRKSPMPAQQKLEIEAAYVRGKPTFSKDLKLIFKTIPAFALGHDGERLQRPFRKNRP